MQVTYGEILITFIGSLSYAENNDRHFLGIKAIAPSSPILASLHSGKAAVSRQDEAVTNGHFCCHVLECVSKVGACSDNVLLVDVHILIIYVYLVMY